MPCWKRKKKNQNKKQIEEERIQILIENFQGRRKFEKTKMVLWEITFGTAYFLGLKRTYRLFLKIQRKLISPKYPSLRDFAHRRTQAAFDVALTIYRKVQERDIEAGSNNNAITSVSKQLTNSSHSPNPETFQKYGAGKDKESSSRHLFTSARNTWQKAYPTISMMIKPRSPAEKNIQYR
ncbi:hypothetical protein T459_26708 [Capsicum annuum]|uniref:Uncharacterized protein n=1 Tax=Capsicum annuum TaxID=4072 RepID=A0A2G2YCD8_CAPAN|nr:hypothetical protein T459_26708 [Capsicum annuum]